MKKQLVAFNRFPSLAVKTLPNLASTYLLDTNVDDDVRAVLLRPAVLLAFCFHPMWNLVQGKEVAGCIACMYTCAC